MKGSWLPCGGLVAKPLVCPLTPVPTSRIMISPRSYQQGTACNVRITQSGKFLTCTQSTLRYRTINLCTEQYSVSKTKITIEWKYSGITTSKKITEFSSARNDEPWYSNQQWQYNYIILSGEEVLNISWKLFTLVIGLDKCIPYSLDKQASQHQRSKSCLYRNNGHTEKYSLQTRQKL